MSRSRPEGAVAYIVGLSLSVSALGIAVCGAVDVIDGNDNGVRMLASAAALAVPGLLLWRLVRPPQRIGVASIYGCVLGSWVAFCIAAAVPYLVTEVAGRWDRALFEAVSGVTTTASSVLQPVEELSMGLLLWRSATQWLGAIGVIVFVVSVVPFLRGAGADQVKGIAGAAGDRLAPRVQETARRLVVLYLGFTVVIAVTYAVLGMGAFDALNHAFTTVSTGGFSTRSGSIGAFDSAAIEWAAIAFMVLAGGNFALYWRALRGKPLVLVRSIEFRVYILILTGIAAAAVVWNSADAGWSVDAIRQTVFGTVSIGTTTGYAVADYESWNGALQLLLVFAMAIGGMAGSSAGGFKIFRLLGVVGHLRRHLFRQLHPRAVEVVRVGGEIIPDSVVSRILGFFGLFMGIGAIATFGVAAFSGLDLRASISAVTSSIGNVGLAFGPAQDYLGMDPLARLVLIVVMLIGRLEIYPVLIGIVPAARWLNDKLPPRLSQLVVKLGRG